MKLTKAVLIAAATLAGCKSAPKAVQVEHIEPISAPVISPTVKALPKAVVYKMEGEAGPENVPVTINPSTGNLIGFPGPGDVEGQEPIYLGSGWYLDRRGVNENTRFTRWTYSEYQSLKSVPTISEIKAAIIPGARVVDLKRLQMTPTEAASDTTAIKKLLGID